MSNTLLLTRTLWNSYDVTKMDTNNYEETQLILINFHFHFFKAKLGLDLGLKVCAGGGMPNITIGITGLLEFLGRDAGLKNPIWDPLNYWATAVTPRQAHSISIDINIFVIAVISFT